MVIKNTHAMIIVLSFHWLASSYPSNRLLFVTQDDGSSLEVKAEADGPGEVTTIQSDDEAVPGGVAS